MKKLTIKNTILSMVFAIIFSVGVSCMPTERDSAATLILIDISKSYANNVEDALLGVNRILVNGQYSHYFAVGVTADRSFTNEGWVHTIKLKRSLLQRNKQIIDYADLIKTQPIFHTTTNNTDLRGAVLSAQQKIELLPVTHEIWCCFQI